VHPIQYPVDPLPPRQATINGTVSPSLPSSKTALVWADLRLSHTVTETKDALRSPEQQLRANSSRTVEDDNASPHILEALPAQRRTGSLRQAGSQRRERPSPSTGSSVKVAMNSHEGHRRLIVVQSGWPVVKRKRLGAVCAALDDSDDEIIAEPSTAPFD
jgi:hypothetical protein